MTLSPKQRFQRTEDAKKHLDLVTQDSFLNAVTIALVQMQMETPPSKLGAESCDLQNQLQGAKRFVDILLNLAEPEKPIKKPATDNLQPPK